MAVTEPIEGRYVVLRSCTEDDAEFTRDIRKDPEFAKYLPQIDNTLDQQKVWIKSQREKPGDYMLIMKEQSDLIKSLEEGIIHLKTMKMVEKSLESKIGARILNNPTKN